MPSRIGKRVVFGFGILVLFLFGQAFGQTKNHNLPRSDFLVERSGYTLLYDGRTKTAHWVVEELQPFNLEKRANRHSCKFEKDSSLPHLLQSTKEDYRHSGFDRGHLAPAGDFVYDQAAMQETFFLSNMSPQLPIFNRGYWKKLEEYVRELVIHSEGVQVITGPLYLPETRDDGRRFVCYEVIGDNAVAVPTHFFKVITKNVSGKKSRVVFLLPNEEIRSDTPLESFMTSQHEVEKWGGFLLPPM